MVKEIVEDIYTDIGNRLSEEEVHDLRKQGLICETATEQIHDACHLDMGEIHEYRRKKFIEEALINDDRLTYLCMMSREEIEQHCQSGLNFFASQVDGHEEYIEYHAFLMYDKYPVIMQWRVKILETTF
jgi:hypothetical protein